MKIDAAIIGVHKCGTTSLLEMLCQHPSLNTHMTGQWPYFLKEDNYREAFQTVIHTYFKNHDPSKKVIVRDTSLYLDSIALTRLKELNPDVKAILIIREPVERAYSAFCFGRSKGFETEEDFGKIIAEQQHGPFITDKPLICNYVLMGLYYRNIKTIESVLSKDRLLILLATDLKTDPINTCNKIFRFLDIPEIEVSAVITNQTRQTRSSGLEFFLHKDTALKRALKMVFPLHTRVRIRKFLSRINDTDTRYGPISKEHAAMLHEIFQEENRKLEIEYGIGFT